MCVCATDCPLYARIDEAVAISNRLIEGHLDDAFPRRPLTCALNTPSIARDPLIGNALLGHSPSPLWSFLN